jgi:hypothetical protein
VVFPKGQPAQFPDTARLLADFQFAEMALLKLEPGMNHFLVHGAVEGMHAELRSR